MKEKKIKLLNPDLAHEFVKCASTCNFDIDILYDHISIDAKSTIGVFSMDFNKPITVRFSGDNNRFENLLGQLAVS